MTLAKLCEEIEDIPSVEAVGQVTAAAGAMIHTKLRQLQIGDMCYLDRGSKPPLPAQVVSFTEAGAQLAPFGPLSGIGPGAAITVTGEPPILRLPRDLPGKILDCLGIPLSGLKAEQLTPQRTLTLPLEHSPPRPLERPPIDTLLHTGIHAIDGCCPIGYGQRIGLFAGPGVGKSTLLGMIAKTAAVDRVVIALVGERGREVREFIDGSLGEEGLARSVVVVSTSDESAVRRKLAAFTATRIAEHYRDRGERVLLMVDSLTRTARAIRDLTLAAGELPVRQGYTCSVFEELPRLIERAGTSSTGSITAIYTVLTGYDDSRDALADELKSLLDGHIVLDREIAERGIFPAIDLTTSVSRLFTQLFSKEEQRDAQIITRLLGRLKRDRDLALLGGRPDKELALAIELEPMLARLFSQGSNCDLTNTDFPKEIRKICNHYEERIGGDVKPA